MTGAGMLDSLLTYAPVLVIVGCVLYFLAAPLITAWRARASPQFAVETYFQDPQENYAKKLFPSIFDPPSLFITLVVPAYNEELRLAPMMDETMRYLRGRQQQDERFTYEVIIVDDGSTDQTVRVAHGYSRKYGADVVRLLQLQRNHGKGGAVRKGMLRGRGRYLLMVDADGATRINDLEVCMYVIAALLP